MNFFITSGPGIYMEYLDQTIPKLGGVVGWFNRAG